MKILVVEDDESTAGVIGEVLREYGMDPEITCTRAAAMKAASEGAFDVALLDYWIDDGTAEPVAAVLRKRGIPYVMITAGSNPERLAEAIQAEHWLRKPFGLEDLARAVLEAFRRKSHPAA